MRILFLILIFILTIFISGCIQTENDATVENATVGNVTGQHPSLSDIVKKIKNNPYDYLTPYDGFSYDNITVSVEENKITVRAVSKDLEGEDIYVFVYDNGTLVLKSYCLEALPLSVKDKAVGVALSNETIYKNAEAYVQGRRILPHTSAKFYMPKELFSVTWHGERVVSALVDLDEETVVNVYIS
jgi:uncharacterized protein YkvS